LLAKPNVKVLYRTQVTEVMGDEHVSGVILNGKQSFPLDGLFLAIGSKPNTRMFHGILQLDPQGYIVVKEGQKTSVEGVYAVGDIVDPIYKQAISAAGDGAKAALMVQQYLSDRLDGLVVEIQSMEQFHKEFKGSRVPVLVDFYAPWCGPCKKISPVVDAMAAKLSGKVKFLKVNLDKLHELGSLYGVRSMPTAILFSEAGEVLERKVGQEQVASFLRSLVQSPEVGSAALPRPVHKATH
jgi:thioredoxin reductase (NADPH)